MRQGANPYFANESKCDKTRNLILRTALSANFIDFRDLSQILTIREFYVRAEPFSQFRRSLTLSFAFGPTIDFLIRVPSLILPIRVLFRSLLAFMERKIFGFNMNLSLVFPLGF